MPRWRLSLPPPAAPTSPSRLHRSSSPHRRRLTITPSHDVELQSRRPSPSIAVHHGPSPRRPSPPSCHHAVLIHPSPLQPQSIAIALALSLTVSCRAIHRRQGAVRPSIAVAPHRPSPSRSRPCSLSIRLLLSSHRLSVHCCPSLLSRRRAFHCRRPSLSITIVIAVHHHHRRDHAVPRSITVEEPPRRPLPSRSHRHRAVAGHRPSLASVHRHCAVNRCLSSGRLLRFLSSRRCLLSTSSGFSARHVQPFSDARHYSLTCWEAACMVLRRI
jgi:hypothetical protein